MTPDELTIGAEYSVKDDGVARRVEYVGRFRRWRIVPGLRRILVDTHVFTTVPDGLFEVLVALDDVGEVGP